MLKVSNFKDHSPIGLQVEGSALVEKIVTGVSASLELFNHAREENANLILVHHGMFWDSDSRNIHGSVKERLSLLLKNNISLAGYHLPLDAHPIYGNNAQILKILNLIKRESFGMYEGKSIGFIGYTRVKEDINVFIKKLKRVIDKDIFTLKFGKNTINKVAVCSGGAPELVKEAIKKKADVFLTGEATEWVYHLCKEEKIHYIAAGHHATERFGIHTLGNHLQKKFKIKVKFIDLPNPIK
ncbi:MAG TPA: Nif3-like dinuclear metal center hexameric protein [Nitrospina sp.]|nr:Nif3-like dinuclear metal center hexameric protein [Nitrospina sp.]